MGSDQGFPLLSADSQMSCWESSSLLWCSSGSMVRIKPRSRGRESWLRFSQVELLGILSRLIRRTEQLSWLFIDGAKSGIWGGLSLVCRTYKQSHPQVLSKSCGGAFSCGCFLGQQGSGQVQHWLQRLTGRNLAQSTSVEPEFCPGAQITLSRWDLLRGVWS